jgi:tRNA A-37 threonylcarbamoyl transferase component Bud32
MRLALSHPQILQILQITMYVLFLLFSVQAMEHAQDLTIPQILKGQVHSTGDLSSANILPQFSAAYVPATDWIDHAEDLSKMSQLEEVQVKGTATQQDDYQIVPDMVQNKNIEASINNDQTANPEQQKRMSIGIARSGSDWRTRRQIVRNLLLADFNLLTLQQKAKKLTSAPLEHLPVSFDDNIVLTKYVSRGGSGIVYEAHLKEEPGTPLIFKIFHQGDEEDDAFQEAVVLNQLERLVYYIKDPWILLFNKIEGDDLCEVIRKNNNQEMYKEEYSKLSRDFYDKTGYIHGDIRPQNVIVNKETGQLQLIDFGRSFDPLQQEKLTLEQAFKIDEEYAMQEYNFSILHLKMIEAYNNPIRNNDTFKVIESYIDSLSNHRWRRHESIAEIEKYAQYLTQIDKMDESFKYYKTLKDHYKVPARQRLM